MKAIRYIHEPGDIPTSLSELPLFSRLRKGCLDEILDNASILEAEPGETVIEEGGRSHALYILLSGALAVEVDGRPVATLEKPGELFGEMAWVTREPHGASVVATRRSTIFRIDAVLERTLSDENLNHFHAVIYRYLTELLARRLRETTRRVKASTASLAGGPEPPEVYHL